MGMRFVLILAGTVGVAVVASRLPWALSHVDLFRVQHIELEGARYLTRDEAIAAAQVADDANIWDDSTPWASRLELLRLVSDVTVHRRIPGTLVFRVSETEPVALVPTPTLEPVDSRGRVLPIDPAAHRLDLPVLRALDANGGAQDALTPAQARLLAGEVERLARLAPDFVVLTSEACLDTRGDMIVRWPTVEFRFKPPLTADRLQQGVDALEDAVNRWPDRTPRAIDLRYAEQVVVRFATNNGR